MCWKKSIIGKTIAFSKKVGNIKFSVQCSLDNFRSYDVSYDVSGLSRLIINQIIKPIIPVINTIINHNTPLSPRFSASLYTHTAIKIATINQTAAIARPKIAHAAP
jgi:hypothetical protein